MNRVTHPLSSTDISNFSTEISKFCYIKKHMYGLHFDKKYFNYFNFSCVFKDCFNKKVTILMMSAKMTTPGFLKITVF